MDIREQIGNRITKSRKTLGITIKELAARTNNSLSAGRISNWEQGTRSPGPLEAKLLASLLNVTASYLLCLTDNPQGELSAGNTTRFIPLIDMKDASQAKELLSTEHPVCFDEAEKVIIIDHFNKSSASASLFAVQVVEASMQPEVRIGDLVIVDVELMPNPGDLVLVHLPTKKQTVLRKYGEAEGCLFQLLADNELWATIHVKNKEDAEIVGVVVEHRRYF
ncbi:MAG: XRE family transcriptional regulator [Legionellales bacterium RIFCSPHIGHO2_12_FULL_35_11]|nr:MAG: XRE family transcriptional regulator [Legionellales bacterium RIFCSPHIGHO2_12_FULL_35_11]